MVIQVKKIVIIFIFLISVIIMLGFENYSLKQDSYNVLLVSNEDDLTKESITSNIWNNLGDINMSDNKVLSKNVNYKYLEIKKSEVFEASISENIKDNDLIIIVGDTYNSKLDGVLKKYTDTKFLLIGNNYKYLYDNVYSINMKWEDVYSTIETYLNEQVDYLYEEGKLKDDEKLTVFLVKDKNFSVYDTLEKELDSKKFQFEELDYEKIKLTDFEKFYEEQEEMFIINLTFKDDEDIIKKLVNIQKDNIYAYYHKKPIEYKNEGANTRSDDTKEEDKVTKNIPIHYIGFYEGDIALGQYDNVLSDEVYEQNILVYDFSVEYTEYIEEIIAQKTDEKNYELKISDNTLKFDII